MAGNVTGNTEGLDLDFSSTAIPDAGRMERRSLAMAWWAVCSAMFYIVVGATLAQQFGTKNAIIGLILTVISYAVVSSIFARYAIKTGLSVALISRVLFGKNGATLAILIFFATAVYYTVFEGSVIAAAIQASVPSLDIKLAYLIVMLYSVPLVFGSVQNWLDKLNGVLLPFYIVGLLGAVGFAIAKYGYSSEWLRMAPEGGASSMGWLNCFAYYMGVWIVIMYAWDYSRFGKEEDAEFHAKINFGIPFYTVTFLVNGLAGIFLASTIPTEGGISEISVVLGLLELMGIFGLIFIWATQTRINSANMFLSVVNLEALLDRVSGIHLPKVVTAIIVGCIVYALMLTDVFSFILEALAYQGIFVVAWCAIALTHILSPKYRKMFGDRVEYRLEHVPSFNPGGLIAWFVATTLGIFLYKFGGDNFAVYSAPATFLSAFLIYKGMLCIAKPGWFVVQRD